MPRSRPVSSLADVLPQVVKKLRGPTRPSKEVIEEAWKRVVGEKAARNSWPRRLTGGRLLVEVGNSGWMYTLSPLKTRILEGLIEILGAGQMKSLSFRIGEGKDA